MKHLFIFFSVLIPLFSFASFVPPQIPAQNISDRFYFSETFLQTSFSDLLNGDYFCPPYLNSSYNQILVRPFASDSYYDVTGPGGGSYFGSGSPCTSSANLMSYYSISTSSLTSIATAYPGYDYIFVPLIFCSSGGGCDNSASSTVIGYMKFRFDGTKWVDTLGAGASGSWDFSTSSSLLPGDFSSFAQGIKDAIANNTYNPDCPTLSSILEIGSSSFWQDCVLPSVFNWLFVPSDSAIDYMVEQMSSNAQYGSSFAYMLIMPVASAVSVTACDLDDVPSCSVGSPLTLPLLDVHGSSTPFVLDPVSPLPAYFDDWLSSIVSVLILAGVSRVVLHKFL